MNSLKKLRADAWESALSEEQRWTLYERGVNRPYTEVIAWAVAEFGIQRPAIQTYYNFMDRMRQQSFGRKIQQIRIARAEIGKLARESAADETLVEAYMSMAADLAVKGDAADAVMYTKMALDIQKQATSAKALELSKEKFDAQEKRLNAVRDALGKAREKGGISAEVLREIEEAAKLT